MGSVKQDCLQKEVEKDTPEVKQFLIKQVVV